MVKSSLLFFFLGVVTIIAQPPQPAGLAPRESEVGVVFQCYAPEAKKVFLAGDFNQFALNRGGRIHDPQFAMTGPDEQGIFRRTVNLPPGLYRYKFAIESDTWTWFVPAYEVERDGDGNAFFFVDGIPDGPNRVAARGASVKSFGVIFELFAPHAHIVYLAGDFNEWAHNKDGKVTDLRYAMRGPDEFGIWRATLPLPPGRHTYQYVIDGREWISDPMAKQTTPDQHSIVEVNP